MGDSGRVFRYVLKRWYIIIICAVIGAGLLYAEKSQVAPSTELNGDLLYTRVIRVEPVPSFAMGNFADEIDLVPMTNTRRSYKILIAEIGASMDLERMNRRWANLKQSEKVKWLSEHFHVSHIGPGLYELEAEFASADAKDTRYLEENSKRLMDVYMQAIEKITSMQRGEATLQIVEDFNLSETKEVVTQQGLQKKYIIVGLVLGGLAGAASLAVLSQRRKEEG